MRERNGKIKLISKLLRKRSLLFSATVVLQCSIYLSAGFPLWFVRAQENFTAGWVSYNQATRELRIKLKPGEEQFFSPGKAVKISLGSSSIEGTVNGLSRYGKGNLLSLKLAQEKNHPLPPPDSGEVKLTTRSQRILEILWGKWSKTNLQSNK